MAESEAVAECSTTLGCGARHPRISPRNGDLRELSSSTKAAASSAAYSVRRGGVSAVSAAGAIVSGDNPLAHQGTLKTVADERRDSRPSQGFSVLPGFAWKSLRSSKKLQITMRFLS